MLFHPEAQMRLSLNQKSLLPPNSLFFSFQKCSGLSLAVQVPTAPSGHRNLEKRVVLLRKSSFFLCILEAFLMEHRPTGVFHLYSLT